MSRTAQRIVKLLGVSSPISIADHRYQIWFGMKYTVSGSDFTTRTITALQYALEEGSRAILFWPIFLFILSIVGALDPGKRVRQLFVTRGESFDLVSEV